MSKAIISALLLLALASCARTSAMPLARNVVQITVNAPPACGTAGAQRVALKLAAAETARRDFDRFVIGSTSTTAERTGGGVSGATVIGNQVYFNQMPTSFRRNQVLNVVMLKPSDPGYENALSASDYLVENWETEIVPGKRIPCEE